MSEKRKKSNRISIYLIKEDINYEEILKDYAYKNILREDINSVTYYYPTTQNKPEWLISYFNETQEVEICNSNAKVISLHRLVIDGKEKIFAIPFGNGKSLLNDDVIEEQDKAKKDNEEEAQNEAPMPERETEEKQGETEQNNNEGEGE